MWSHLFIPCAESKSQVIVKKLSSSYTNQDIFGLTHGLSLTQGLFGPSGNYGDSCNGSM